MHLSMFLFFFGLLRFLTSRNSFVFASYRISCKLREMSWETQKFLWSLNWRWTMKRYTETNWIAHTFTNSIRILAKLHFEIFNEWHTLNARERERKEKRKKEWEVSVGWWKKSATMHFPLAAFLPTLQWTCWIGSPHSIMYNTGFHWFPCFLSTLRSSFFFDLCVFILVCILVLPLLFACPWSLPCIRVIC